MAKATSKPFCFDGSHIFNNKKYNLVNRLQESGGGNRSRLSTEKIKIIGTLSEGGIFGQD